MPEEHIKANIDSLKAQGASDADVQGYLDTLKTQAPDNSIPGGGPNSLLQKVIPAQNIGKILGTALGIPYTLATSGIEGLKNYDFNPHASASGVAADVGGIAANTASLLAAPETGGASLLGRMGVNATLSGGLNLANSMSNGESVSNPEVWKNAAGSALLGSIFPVLGKSADAINAATKATTGITPQIETVLKGSNPEEVKNYIESALTHNANLNSPTPMGLASSQVETAGQTIKNNLKTVGTTIGNALKTDGSKLIGIDPTTNLSHTDELLSNFNKMIEDTFGHEVYSGPADKTNIKIGGETMHFGGTPEPQLMPLEGRMRNVAGPDQKRILDIHNQITQLADHPTITKATDVVHNLDDLVDWTKRDQYGVSHDPLEGILAKTRGTLNTAIRQTSPAIADANNQYANLKRLEEGLGDLAGKDLQRGSLLIQRVFSGDKSAETVKLMQDIKDETGIDLIRHAGLAKFATENFGDASSKTLLRQALNMEGSIAGGLKRAVLTPIKAVTQRALVPDTANYAMRLAGGSKYAGKIDELLNSSQGQNLVRTYLDNTAAAHPGGGRAVGRSISNLIGNTVGS